MKKGVLSLVAVLLVAGCGCSKVDEDTYKSAVDTFKTTDAISFSRIEIATDKTDNSYFRENIKAKYVFNSNREVVNMMYDYDLYQGTVNGRPQDIETKTYYYNGNRSTLYTYNKIGEYQVDSYKERDVTYNSKFNINTCLDNDCMLMITSNLAPIFKIDEVADFSIEDDDGKGIVKFNAICPSFENCSSNSQMIEYNLIINEDGNISNLSYIIENGNISYDIKYTFHEYGSNNVTIDFPVYLESYIKK